ncbi:MAG: hypothetical protein K2K36_01620 [Muribaculaceae bacterium]|nr:hypothetical protein [Muribaculaceae bacterium]
MLATVTVQPHCKKAVTPRQLIPFPWDHENNDAGRPASKQSAPRLTPAQRAARLAELQARGIGELKT